jgi:hypothetical protein
LILFIVRIENGENPYPGLTLPVDYDFDLDDIDIENEENDWDPINREFASDFTITSLPDDRGYDVVEVNRDELAYKQQVNLTGYCNAENDQQNNLWVTLESPFLTKKIRQKFPSLPGYVIQNNRSVGDNEISITSNGNYILGQNDQDPDDLEMDEEVTPNQNRSLILSKNEETTPTFVLGKFNVNVPQTTINNYTQPTITTNGTYTIPNGYTGFNNFTVSVTDYVFPTVTFNTISTNGTYTLSQLTSDQSEYFSKNSTIKINISTIRSYHKSKFQYSIGSDDVLQTPTWGYGNSNITPINLGAKKAIYIFRNYLSPNYFKIFETVTDDENTDAKTNVSRGDYYFIVDTNQTTDNVKLKLWYDGSLFKETSYYEADTVNAGKIYTSNTYPNSQFYGFV